MASTTQNVVRYTALLSGIAYGLLHQSTLQVKYDAEKTKRHAENRQHLIEKAREAYVAKQLADKAGGSALITDIENPAFDLEKVIESFTKA